ncbi:MAG: type IV pilus modification PilV family protein [bacterium]
MDRKRRHGLSLIEVLISASLFTIVILGISQSVLLMHRYSRATLCQYKAHLLATSYFESLLCDTHPYDLNKNKVTLRRIDVPSCTFTFNYDKDDYAQSECSYTHRNDFTTSIYDNDNDLKIYMVLKVEESPLCKVYKINNACEDSIENSLARVCINPPEGFQSLRMTYWYTSPFMDSAANNETEGSINYLEGLEKGELYAIRPLIPDDPEYDM